MQGIETDIWYWRYEPLSRQIFITPGVISYVITFFLIVNN